MWFGRRSCYRLEPVLFSVRHSYRHLAEMMQERGFEVHHTTIYRWIQTYAPQLEKLIRWYQGPHGLLVASR